jgi:cyclic pyranopterin phosphate synthase
VTLFFPFFLFLLSSYSSSSYIDPVPSKVTTSKVTFKSVTIVLVMMQDRQGRTIDYLRISLNRACNLRCLYCHNEGQHDGADRMGPDDIEILVRAAASLGIGRLKITGGEPLLRPDVVDIVERVSPLVKEVSMTTNGVLLAPLAGRLRDAGLTRVNISLDSIYPTTYRRICGSDLLGDVLAGLDAALEAGLDPVKINMVLLAGYNAEELPDMLEFVAKKGATLQLIEYVVRKEDEDDSRFREHHLSISALEGQLQRDGELVGRNPLHGRGRYRLEAITGNHHWTGRTFSRPVEVELVTPMHNHGFCDKCRRIRITSSGKIKGCLFQEKGAVNALDLIRANADDAQIREAFEKVVASREPYWRRGEGTEAEDGMSKVEALDGGSVGPMDGTKGG